MKIELTLSGVTVLIQDEKGDVKLEICTSPAYFNVEEIKLLAAAFIYAANSIEEDTKQ